MQCNCAKGFFSTSKDKAGQDTRLWLYSELKPTMFASSVQAAVASNVTAPRVCTLALFIINDMLGHQVMGLKYRKVHWL